MYDGLYARIPEFERRTGVAVEVVARLPHPELNARIDLERARASDAPSDLDLVSTHTKYAPAQARWLAPLDGLVDPSSLADLLPRPLELARVSGQLLQFPRNLDCGLLYYRRDLFENERLQGEFERTHRRPLRVPETWDELVEVAIFLSGHGVHGFLFPGRASGLFGVFYQLLVCAGGELFDEGLRPAFDSPAGYYAADVLAELHHRRRTTPVELQHWHFDEVSAAYRRGEAAMVADWPGSDHLYTDPRTSVVADRTGIARLPGGFGGRRAAYAGCHSFAIPKGARNPEGALELLGFLTSVESQIDEAGRGALPVRRSAFAAMREAAKSDPRQTRRLDLLAQTSDDLIIPPRFAAYPDCEDAIWHGLQKAMTGAVSPRQAVEEAARAVDAVVARSVQTVEVR